jgi:drug/metabolite transporter (DMT)-like permease
MTASLRTAAADQNVQRAVAPGNPPTSGIATTRGILLVLLGWFLLACMDAGSKRLAEDYSIIQILWLRFLVLFGIAYALARRQGGRYLHTRHFWLQSLRSLILVTEIGIFILTITLLPLANAHAILAVTPLIVTALSVPLLGEKVGARRWSAIAVAFLGVLVILRPGPGVIYPGALLALLCAFMFAFYQVFTRMVGRDDGPAVTLFYTALIGVLGLSAIGPFFWTWPDATGWALFGLVSMLGASGHFLLIHALRLAPASSLQPFSYSMLVWATIVGFLFFDTLPDVLTVLGALVIAASGLYAFARERRVAQKERS